MTADGIILFSILILIFSNAAQTRQGGHIANRYFLEKQKFLIEILLHVEQPLLNREWLGIGKQLLTNESNYLYFNDEMRQFQRAYNNGNLLAKEVVFNLRDQAQYHQTYGLFYHFNNANDWETLLLNACWARTYLNPGMFVFALTQALIKRCDLKGLHLPQIYEIMPEVFLNPQSVHTALKFDYGQHSHEEFLYKDYTSYKKPKGEIYSQQNQRQQTKHPKLITDFTRLILNDLTEKYPTSLSYFTEDIDWNTFWYYQNMGLWWQKDEDEKTMVETYFGLLQQVLARYKLELYSWRSSTILKGFKTPLRLLYTNGNKFRENFEPSDDAFKQFTASVHELISEQKLALKNGSFIRLEGGQHWPLVLNHLFGENLVDFYERYFHASTPKQPAALSYFETQLRVPIFYEKAELLLKNYQLLRSNFQTYKLSNLKLPDVNITNVTISKLQTYFETFHFDASNLLPSKHFYYDGNLLWQKTLHARQQRLQHKPFNITFNISANAAEAVVVRGFLAKPPTTPSSSPSPLDFFHFDTFAVNLVAGSNVIVRHSTEFSIAPKRIKLDVSSLYRLTLLGLDEKYDFPLNISTAKCAFPQHLLLPRGDPHGAGLPVKFFFIATAYAYRYHEAADIDCDFNDGIRHFDELPLTFPFDYEHDELESWLAERNVYWKREKIFHF